MEQAIVRYFELSLFAMVATGFLVLAGTGKLDMFSMIVVGIALLLRARQIYWGGRFLISERMTTRLTLAYVVFYLADFWMLSRDFVQATVHLVLLVMVTKLFSVHRERDNVYLAVISFLMVLAAAILTVDTLFLAEFCLYLLLAVSTFVSMEIRRSMRSASRQNENGQVRVLEGARVSGRVAKSLGRTAAVLLTGTLLLAAIMFFILPRYSGGYLSEYAVNNEFVSGFGDDVQLGQIGEIQRADNLVMHVQFDPGELPPDEMKWRGVALSLFDGHRWYNQAPVSTWRLPPDAKLQLDLPPLVQYIQGTTEDRGGLRAQRLHYRVIMEPIGSRAFFLLSMPIWLKSETRGYSIDSLGSVYSSSYRKPIGAYEGESEITQPGLEAKQALVSDIPIANSSRYLNLPMLDPRIPQLAREITVEKQSAYARAAAIEQYLKTNYQYSLEMYTEPGADPLAYFLFTRKKGHCEYFASAMAVMLRTLHIPSRIINGFRGGEYNDVSGSWVIRGRDAHSWVEAYIPGFGWTEFDPTPSAGAPPKPQGIGRIALYLDAMREFWREWIINYDFGHQETLGTSLALRLRRKFDQVRSWIRIQYETMLESARHAERSVRRQPMRWSLQGVLLIALFGLAGLAPIALRWWKRMRAARNTLQAPRTAATVWYERMLHLLKRHGVEHTAAQTPEEVRRSVREPQLRTRVTRFTEHYERARFGGSAEDAVKLPELYEELEEEVKR
jgi:transglutaminase-like putative cysteine protease